jgi:hypothetical protein
MLNRNWTRSGGNDITEKVKAQSDFGEDDFLGYYPIIRL